MRRIAIFVVAFGLTASSAWAWPGLPSTKPPKPAQGSGPPPAWVETTATSTWLAYGSYCWRTTCADYLPPQQRPDLPRLTVRRGSVARIHLAFVPKSIGVRKVPQGTFVRLKPARVVTWRPTAGVLAIEVKAPGGSASYLVRVTAP